MRILATITQPTAGRARRISAGAAALRCLRGLRLMPFTSHQPRITNHGLFRLTFSPCQNFNKRTGIRNRCKYRKTLARRWF